LNISSDQISARRHIRPLFDAAKTICTSVWHFLRTVFPARKAKTLLTAVLASYIFCAEAYDNLNDSALIETVICKIQSSFNSVCCRGLFSLCMLLSQCTMLPPTHLVCRPK